MKNDSKNIVVVDYFLKPGFIYLPQEPTAISAVVGSSVAVCLFDKKKKIGGMNLYKLPAKGEKEKAFPIYGNVATRALVTMMIHQGSKVKHIQSQIFGGAFNGEVSPRDIGRDNIAMARRILNRMHIHIVSEDVGGSLGRKIIFNTMTNDVAILKTSALRASDWYPYEEKGR